MKYIMRKRGYKKWCNSIFPRTLLIRHSTNHKRFVQAYSEGYLREYTQYQEPGFFDKYDFVIVFSGDKGTTAKYLKSYEVRHEEGHHMYTGRSIFLYEPSHNNVMHTLIEIDNDQLTQYENKLFIEWGEAAIKWAQIVINEKPITQLANTHQFNFPGFENVAMKYEELKEMCDGSDTYADWHKALSSINAIYAITDCSNGKLYIGSSYNKGGLLGRWKDYADTVHGGNNALKSLYNQNNDAHLQFQYSILKVLPKDVTPLEAVEIEKKYKQKLQTIKYGYNEN
ncbi:GIY-YIG nuclease family protein [Bacillus luti]